MFRRFSPFTVGTGIFLLLLMGISALDGEISGNLFGKHGPENAIYVSQEPFLQPIGWVFILAAILLGAQFVQRLRKR